MSDHCDQCPLRDEPLVRAFCGEQCVYEDEEDPWLEPEKQIHNLGNWLYRREEFRAAECCYLTTLRMDASLLESWFNLGLARTRMQHYEEAIEAMDKVIELAPHLSESYYTKGLIYRYMGKLEEALACQVEAVRLGYRLAEGELAYLRNQLQRGRIDAAASNGDYGEALALLRKQMSRYGLRSPDRASVLMEMADVSARTGDLETARRFYARAARISPSASTCCRVGEFMVRHLSERAQGRQWLERAAATRSHPRADLALGQMYQQEGQLVLARAALERAFRGDPKDAETRYELAELLGESLGEVARALRLLARLEAGKDPYWKDRARRLRRRLGA